MSEIVRSLDPDTMSEIAKRILVEFSKVPPKSVAVTSRASQSRRFPGASGNEIAAAPSAGLQWQNRAPNGQVPGHAQQEEMNLTGIAVITHPSNPVDELTLDQVRKIYTGEYDNWSQVGGPDQQVNVMTVGEMPGVQPKLTSNASVSAFASNVFMGVAGTSGAIGFVPTNADPAASIYWWARRGQNNGSQN